MKAATVNKKKSVAKKKSNVAASTNKHINKSTHHFPVVAIGASAGGLEAMIALLNHLPPDTGMAFIYVQHLSPDHKSMLTEILSKRTKMKVQEVDDMDKIKPDNVFVIPSNKGIEVTDGHIKLIPRSESSTVISIDILFSSLAEAHKDRVIGIVLSGSASDGTIGIKAIKHEGGLTFAQDDSAKFTSMPHSAIAAGAVDFILSPKEIALELARLSKHPFVKTNGVKTGKEDLIDNRNPDLKIILNQLHNATGVDFSAYKMNTIKRRIIRRMLLYKISNLKEYAKRLTRKNEEIDILYQDLLINVTSFFRDTNTHKYLKENLFPKLLKRKKTGESLRIWVPACSTGEEAYSIAMILLEIQEGQTTSTPIQIFATDLSKSTISKARIAVYTKLELKTVSPKRIQRFFTKAEGSFRVNKAVREMCVFAPHNILRDPPFSRLDFISCCNLFIYFDTEAQKKAVNTFHYALNNDGFLMLGKAENISQSAHLFTSSNKKYKIFSRKINSVSPRLPELAPRFAHQPESETNVPLANRNKTQTNIPVKHQGLDNAIDAVLVSEYMPASVVINYQMEIVQFRGTTDLFLTHPKGKATFNILKMARPEIAFELRNTISKVIKTNHRIRKSGIELKINGAVRIISLEIVPLKIEWNEPLLLILFTEQEQTEIYSKQATGGKTNSLAKDTWIKKLEQELAAAHADALSTSQAQEAFTEELQSSKEEVVSSNEELQTVNEELETSKEEIESANEELTTTNQELQTRNELLNESYLYSETLLFTVPLPLIILDSMARIKSANKAFYEKYNVTEEETEGHRIYDLGNGQWKIPKLRELLENIIPQNTVFENYEVEHEFESIGKKTMLLNARCIKLSGEELILLAIADVTEMRRLVLEKEAAEKKILQEKIETEQRLKEISKEKQKQLQNIFLNAPAALAIFEGPEHKYVLANKFYEKVTNRKAEDLFGKSIQEVFPELIGTGTLELFDHVFKTGETFSAPEYAVMLDFNNEGVLRQSYFNFSMEPLKNDSGEIYAVMSMAFDVTEQVESRKKIEENEKALKEKNSEMQDYLDNATIGLHWVNADGIIIWANKTEMDLLGYSEDEYIGHHIAEFHADQNVIKNILTLLTHHETLNQYEAQMVCKDGSLRDVIINSNVLWAEDKFIHTRCFTHNVTEKKLAEKKIAESEKQQAFLLKLSDALRPLSNPVDIEGAITQIALDFMGADWCHYVTIEEDNLIIQRGASRDDFPSLAGVYPISSFALFKSVLNTGIPSIVDDVHTTDILDEELKQLCIQLQSISFINVPVIKNGKPVGLLSLVQSKPRKWTNSEVQLSKETAERTWAAVEKAKAEQALQQSEEKYRMLFSSIDEAVSTIDVIFDGNQKAVDFLFIENNSAFTKLTGLPENVIGKRWLEFVPAIDPYVADIFERVIRTGEPVRTENRVENLNRWHNTFFTLSGGAGSNRIICVYSDITDRKNEEEKQTYILKLSDAIKELIDPVDIQLTACRILGEHVKVNRVLYGEVIDEEQIIINNNYINGVPPINATLDAEQFGRNVIDAFKRNEKVIISDITTDPGYTEEAKQSFLSLDVVANVGMGLVKGGRWVATFGMHYNAPRKWTATEIWLLEETAERTWAAVERAKAEQALRKSEEKYRTLFTSIDQGFVLCELVRNKEGKGIDYYMLELNPTYEKQTGLSIEMVLGKTILQVFPTIDKWHIDTYAAVVDNQRPVTFEKYFEVNNRWHEVKVYPGEKDRFTVLFSDITERKQAEEKIRESEKQLRELSTVLEQKVHQRTTQLEEKNTELQSLNRELEAFTYVSSHDLQEPLRKIQTFAGRILEKENQNLTDNGKNYFRLMQNAAERMQTLIQDLLAFSKLSIADRTFETTDLNIIIEEVKNELKDAIAEKHAVITVKGICDVKIIPFQFRQLMHNLISNALKFSNPKIPPHITIESCNIKYSQINIANLPPQKEYCHITINDNGIGFEEKFSEKIFEVFQKLHGKEEYAGTGIGLAIVKKIIENHSGIITATSELTKGTTFNIYIPA